MRQAKTYRLLSDWRVRSSLLAAVLVTAAMSSPVQGQDIAHREPFTETRHGRIIDDPYRWMEDPARKDAMVAYVRSQSQRTTARLAELPQHAAWVKLIDEGARAGARISALRVAGDHAFWRQLDSDGRVPKLMERSGGRTRVLYDPAKEPENAAGPAAINSYNVSPDGRTVALHVSFGGAEIGSIRFLDSRTGCEMLPRVDPIWGEFTAQWLDRDTVAVTRMAPHREGVDELTGMTAVVGKPGGAFAPILGPNVRGGPDFPASAFPLIATSPVTDWVVGLADNAGGNPRVFIARNAQLAAGNPRWREIATATDRITEVAARGDSVYLISARDASDGEVVRINGAGASRRKLPLPAGFVLSNIVATRDGIYVHGRREGISHLFWIADGDRAAVEVKLPFAANLTRLATSADGGKASFMLVGWTKAPAGYVVRGGRVASLGIESGSWAAARDLIVKRETARSADGTSVPMVIVTRTDARSGPKPTLIEAYGSYGASTTSPDYDPYYLAWSVRGNNMVYCGTRGGSEYGRAWHDGGREANKPAAHADLIACGERAVQLGLADPRRLAVTGTSAGGLLAPLAAEKRPDLFAALVSRVAILNATRLEVAENGANNYGEMGDPRTEEGWRALAAQDAYLALKGASDLPDTLLTIGLNDHRVAPWMSAKFAATAQERFGDKRLILVRAETEGGHGIGSARDLQVQEYADIYTFLEDRAGAASLKPAGVARR